MRVHTSTNCTSGFSVQTLAGVTGVATAGHCTVTRIVDPGHGTHVLNHQQQHLGLWGDVEWKTTAEAEPGAFYATSNDVREVNALVPGSGIMIGETVCGYGRSSNTRRCLDVDSLSAVCTDPDTNVTVYRQTVMDGDVLIPGDSGGPWSNANTAFGIHYGNCGGNDAFTPADFLPQAIGVAVIVK